MSEREEMRQAELTRPGFYSPWLHLLTPSIVGLVVDGLCLRALVRPGLADLGFALFVFLLANAVEWRIHRDVLHKRFWPFGLLYEKHTPLHHRIYVAGDMQMRSIREARLVLMPFYAILGIVLVSAPPAAALWLLGLHNFGLIYLLVSTLYVVLYEWLHLAYHLPEGALRGPLAAIRVLRRHHEVHHDPRNMQRWNFNVTIPLWDIVRRTRLTAERAHELEAH
jgi:hypothetical protein